MAPSGNHDGSIRPFLGSIANRTSTQTANRDGWTEDQNLLHFSHRQQRKEFPNGDQRLRF